MKVIISFLLLIAGIVISTFPPIVTIAITLWLLKLIG